VAGRRRSDGSAGEFPARPALLQRQGTQDLIRRRAGGQPGEARSVFGVWGVGTYSSGLRDEGLGLGVN